MQISWYFLDQAEKRDLCLRLDSRLSIFSSNPQPIQSLAVCCCWFWSKHFLSIIHQHLLTSSIFSFFFSFLFFFLFLNDRLFVRMNVKTAKEIWKEKEFIHNQFQQWNRWWQWRWSMNRYGVVVSFLNLWCFQS